MGRDKAWLPVGGQPLLARQIGLIRQVAPQEIFISGRADTNYSEFGCPVLTDRVAGAGPLAGVARALEKSAAPLVLVLAVDMPGMEASCLRRLAADCSESVGVIPRVNGRIEPLAAFYPKSARGLAETLLRDDRRAAAGFAADCAQAGLAVILDLPAGDGFYFANWNTPEDGETKVSQL
jgi:molybdopterin-guanine dinucleotide biosynthesis protein A